MQMPLDPVRVYRFPALGRGAFGGLPGLVADALPDTFGNAVIDAWLAQAGRRREAFGPLERLCYVGTRAMGALAFHPATGPAAADANALDVAELVKLASAVLAARQGVRASLAPGEEPAALHHLLQVGTSAGGARAKALVAWNPDTGELRSGQIEAGPGFSQWLLKFDGVSGNGDRGPRDPQGFGAVEYAYHQMAIQAGIRMSECRLLEEGGRRHFLTRRFDRPLGGGRLHLQSLAALAHLDFDQPGAHGYETAIAVARQLRLGTEAADQLFRRMVFNVVARNQDDHVKNMAFLMDQRGQWTLAPAYDVMWAYNPEGPWTSAHQMTINGKRDGFSLADLEAVAAVAHLARGRARAILDEVQVAVGGWREIAAGVRVDDRLAATIGATHRLNW